MKRLFLLLFLSSLAAACGLKDPHAVVLPEEEIFRLQPGQLLLAATEEDIPPIYAREEDFVPAEKAELDREDLVVGLLIGGHARAYPVRLLSLHEVVNDRVGETPLAVTWCPLCFSAVVYHRQVEEMELTFRASGYLLNDNLVLIDHPTDTLWSQLLGQGIKGAQRGTVLEVIPSTLTTWEIWQQAYPDTSLLSAQSLGYEGDIPDPYSGYFASGAAGLGSVANGDDRLPGKTLVWGISLGENSSAYKDEMLREGGLIQDQIGSYPILGVWDPESGIPRFYFRVIGDQELDFHFDTSSNLLVDLTSGSQWEISSGKAIDGRMAGTQLTALQPQQAFWFAWSAFYPETGLFFP